nr:integrase core domain-containing protein [uncultured Undibacterium sp.]
MNVSLRLLKQLNTWTLLGALFLAIGQFGKPKQLRMDNHPVHRAKLFKWVLRYIGIQRRFTQPASPWQNGRIERFFGSFKVVLKNFAIKDRAHLLASLPAFRFWYSNVRTHQYLGGITPAQAWRGIQPFEQVPRQVIWFQAWDQQLRGWLLRH